MDEELKRYMEKITEQLDALLKLIYANTDKRDLCKHLVVEDTGQIFWTASSINPLRNQTVKIVRCINCGVQLQQEVK